MVVFRKARINDVEQMHGLINHYANEGAMLARSRNMLYENIREFTVVEEKGQFLGAGGLHILWEDLAEIRALAIAPQGIGRGFGKRIVHHLLEEAKDLGIPRVFTLTYKPEFFVKCGFELISKDDLPHKVWKECINCPQFPNCDEIALICHLND